MGEMADYYLDQMMEEEFQRSEYRQGKMSGIEAYELGIIDELGYEISGLSVEQPKTCRCCNCKGLYWKKLKGKWRLHDIKGNLHVCSVNPLKDNQA